MAFHVAVMMMMLMLPGFVSTRVPGSHIGSSVALPAPSYEFLEEHSGSLTVDHPPPPPPLLLLHATHNPTGSHRGHARHQPGGTRGREDVGRQMRAEEHWDRCSDVGSQGLMGLYGLTSLRLAQDSGGRRRNSVTGPLSGSA
ncbi:unnamed protein product [Lampetra planeri]